MVTAIAEFIDAIDCYQKMVHLNRKDRFYLKTLQEEICKTSDLPLVFLFLLRQFDSNVQSRLYLKDLISTNHKLLLFLERGGKNTTFRTAEHLKQYVM